MGKIYKGCFSNFVMIKIKDLGIVFGNNKSKIFSSPNYIFKVSDISFNKGKKELDISGDVFYKEKRRGFLSFKPKIEGLTIKEIINNISKEFIKYLNVLEDKDLKGCISCKKYKDGNKNKK